MLAVRRGGRDGRGNVGYCKVAGCLGAFLNLLELFLGVRRILKGEIGIIQTILQERNILVCKEEKNTSDISVQWGHLFL